MKTFCWCLTCLICVYSVYAQGDRGTLTGTIADSTGRVVPNAEVTVKNEGTGIAASTVTGESGSYTMPLLNIGKYTIIARVAGFKTYVRESVPVQVGQTTRVDILLELGRVDESVTVSATAPMLTTDTSEVGIVVNQDKFLDLPLTLGGDFR